ncbi:hypothetical protein [Intestinibacillus sp. Marseille-P6563]|uniref:hypothetical protein n=1 Tax=Intestinibacillus sp. Marseille-P6563 TaxID=2364792 RepID=UPI000F05E364|nr:hypothetical protein [Intestinibacillus sp. Marseille-P6563]
MLPNQSDAPQTVYEKVLARFNEITNQYSQLPMGWIMQAYDRASNNPWIQNRRVKQISSLPAEYSKDDVADAIRSPGEHELMLRQTHHALEATAYPMLKIRKVYTDIMTYRYYTSPHYITETDAKDPMFQREMQLLDKFNQEMDPKATAHKMAGQALQEGKAFYAIRYSVDKAHNKVNYVFPQQLPSNWVKIIGFNNISGYTVSFNMFYFLQPGTDWRQYGDLLEPYIGDFKNVVEKVPSKVVYASHGSYRINLERFNKLKKNAQGGLAGNPDPYMQNGRWAYWVTLPVDRVFVFEIDDTNPFACSPMTGLYLSMQAIAQYEQVQLELVQNPLVSVMTGEIPYSNDNTSQQKDLYKLSNGGRELFEYLWYQMLAQNNTSGIGLYLAPAANLKLHQLTEAPSATEISTNGYAYTVEKSGLAGLIPISDNPRAGTVNISIQIEARYCLRIYQQFEKMMNYLYSRLNLKYEWRFHMFGDIYNDEKMRAEMQKSMTLGLLPDLYVYNALMDRSLLDDMSMSAAVKASGILDKRMPLISSYTAKNGNPKLPPSPTDDKGGRAQVDVSDMTSEGTEDFKDAE